MASCGDIIRTLMRQRQSKGLRSIAGTPEAISRFQVAKDAFTGHQWIESVAKALADEARLTRRIFFQPQSIQAAARTSANPAEAKTSLAAGE